MSDLIRVLKIAGMYTAVTLGAGFASGQELLAFFVSHGGKGFAGLLLSGALFSLVGWAVLEICHVKKLNSYNEFIAYIMGRKLGWFIEYSGALFLFVLFAAMIAGGGALGNQVFGAPGAAGGGVLIILCFFTFMTGTDFVVKINAVLAPVLVLGGIFIGVYTFYQNIQPAFFDYGALVRHDWAMSSVVYTAYNLVTAIAVLASIRELVRNRAVAFAGGLLGGLSLMILGLCLSLPLYLAHNSIRAFQIPMLELIASHGAALEYFYFFILAVAIYTTAVGNCFAFLEWFKSKSGLGGLGGIDKRLAMAIICVLGFAAGQVGFSNFVTGVYPVFAVAGMFEIIVILAVFVLIRMGLYNDKLKMK